MLETKFLAGCVAKLSVVALFFLEGVLLAQGAAAESVAARRGRGGLEPEAKQNFISCAGPKTQNHSFSGVTKVSRIGVAVVLANSGDVSRAVHKSLSE